MVKKNKKLDEKPKLNQGKNNKDTEKEVKERIREDIRRLIEKEITKAVSEVRKEDVIKQEAESLEEKVMGFSLESYDPQLQYGENVSTDYSQLFSYLGNSVKLAETEYNSYVGIHRTNETMREDFFNPKYSEDTMKEVLRAAKIKNTYGVEVYVNPLKKSMFDMWKLGNDSANKIMYDMISI